MNGDSDLAPQVMSTNHEIVIDGNRAPSWSYLHVVRYPARDGGVDHISSDSDVVEMSPSFTVVASYLHSSTSGDRY